MASGSDWLTNLFLYTFVFGLIFTVVSLLLGGVHIGSFGAHGYVGHIHIGHVHIAISIAVAEETAKVLRAIGGEATFIWRSEPSRSTT